MLWMQRNPKLTSAWKTMLHEFVLYSSLIEQSQTYIQYGNMELIVQHQCGNRKFRGFLLIYYIMHTDFSQWLIILRCIIGNLINDLRPKCSDCTRLCVQTFTSLMYSWTSTLWDYELWLFLTAFECNTDFYYIWSALENTDCMSVYILFMDTYVSDYCSNNKQLHHLLRVIYET